jgi:hypothetical protein
MAAMAEQAMSYGWLALGVLGGYTSVELTELLQEI